RPDHAADVSPRTPRGRARQGRAHRRGRRRDPGRLSVPPGPRPHAPAAHRTAGVVLLARRRALRRPPAGTTPRPAVRLSVLLGRGRPTAGGALPASGGSGQTRTDVSAADQPVRRLAAAAAAQTGRSARGGGARGARAAACKWLRSLLRRRAAAAVPI